MSPLIALWLWVGFALGSERGTWHVAMVVDQSCSMTGSHDPDSFAIIAPAIFSDVTGAADRLEVFEQGGSRTPYRLHPDRREDFKNALLGLPGDSEWYPAYERATDSLVSHADVYDRQLLVVVYDGDRPGPSGMFDDRARLLAAGGQGHVIGLGSNASGRPLMKLFGKDHGHAVEGGDELLEAFALIFKTVLGARRVPRGRVSPTFTVEVAPGVSEAWLVALAEGRITGLRETGSNPGATRVQEVPGGGWNRPTPAGPRGYQVLHLVAPRSGTWTFEASTSAPQVTYLLLQYFDLDLVITVDPQPCAGCKTPITVEPRGGEVPQDLEVEVEVDGDVVRLTATADGRYEGIVVPRAAGRVPLQVTARNADVEVTETTVVDVSEAQWALRCRDFTDQVVPVGTEIHVIVTSEDGQRTADRAWLELGGREFELAWLTDHYEGVFPVDEVGPLEVRGWAAKGPEKTYCKATYDVREVVDLRVSYGGDLLELGPCDPDATPSGPGPEGCVACGHCSGAMGLLDFGGTRATGDFSAEFSLADHPSGGIRVHLAGVPPDEGRVRTGEGTPRFVSLARGTQGLLVCGRTCPLPGDHSLDVVVTVPDAFHDDGAGALVHGPQAVTVSVPYRVHPSAFWTCWGWLVQLVTGVLLLALLVYGYVRSLRFPSPGGRGRGASFPGQVAACWDNELQELKRRRNPCSGFKRPTWTWWVDERLHLRADGTPTRDPSAGAVTVSLERDESGRAVARVHSSRSLLRCRWTEEASWWDVPPLEEDEDDESVTPDGYRVASGDVLKLDWLYYFEDEVGSEEDRFRILRFTR